jgi:hypothetical protein
VVKPKKDSLAAAAETMIAEIQSADPGRIPPDQAGRLMNTLRAVSETEQADQIPVQGRKVATLEKQIEGLQTVLSRERKLLERMIDARRYGDCPDFGGHAAFINRGSGLATGSNR